MINLQTTDDNYIRNLGFMERFRVVLHDLGYHYNVGVTATISLDQSLIGCLRPLIFSAFQKAVAIHPALGITVAYTGGSASHFQRIDSIDLSHVITFPDKLQEQGIQSNDDLIDKFLAREHSKAYETVDKPLWRAIILRALPSENNQIIRLVFLWHHVIGDGKSGLAVLRSVMQGLNLYVPSSEQGADPKNWLVQPSVKPLYPPLEQLLSLSRSTPSMSNGVPKDPFPKKWCGQPFNNKAPIQTKIKNVRISIDSTKQLVDQCREHGTTITAMLQALVGKVIFEAIGAERIRAACAISLRRFFPQKYKIDDNVMGLWISAFFTDYDKSEFGEAFDQSVIWDISRGNTKRINHEIAKGDKDIDIGTLQDIDDFKASLLGKIGHDREYTYGFTNLGVFRAPTDDRSQEGWKLLDLSFSQSCHVNGSALQICVVSAEHGNLNIALSWQKDIISDQEADRIAKILEKRLLQLIAKN